MSDVNIQDTNPVPLTAIVTSASGEYTVTVVYNTTVIGELSDEFRALPATLTINVTSSTVPTGHHLATSGDGTWTASSASSLTGSFTVVGDESTYDFTVLLVRGSMIVARVDPRIIIKKLGSM